MPRFTTNKTIDIADLRIGMYVTRLEVPWSATEYSLQGTMIRDRQDILKISRYGRKIVIDQAKSSNRNQPPVLFPLIQETRENKKSIDYKQSPRVWRRFCNQNYQTNKPIAKELSSAKQLLKKIDTVFSHLTSDLRQAPNQIDPSQIETVKTLSSQIVTSLLNNPDALLWLSKVNANQPKIYEHTLRVAIWATLMGRSMGLVRESLKILVESILLSGVGKSYLSRNVWMNYQEDNLQADFACWSNITIEKLSHCKNIESQILTIIANMTERFDGSGYPRNKSAQSIPYLSQIGGLVESFDLILNPMFKDKTKTFGQALSKLYSLADTLFDGALVEEFIQAAGLYPVGTQVLLSDGYSGVVIEQSKNKRLRATVALTHDAEGVRLLKYKIAKLGEKHYHDVIIVQESNQYAFVEDDKQRINKLIFKSQGNPISRFFANLK